MELKDLQLDFKGSTWKHEIDVRDFIQHNYEPYAGDESFLAGPAESTKKLWGKLTDFAGDVVNMSDSVDKFKNTMKFAGLEFAPHARG